MKHMLLTPATDPCPLWNRIIPIAGLTILLLLSLFPSVSAFPDKFPDNEEKPAETPTEPSAPVTEEKPSTPVSETVQNNEYTDQVTEEKSGTPITFIEPQGHRWVITEKKQGMPKVTMEIGDVIAVAVTGETPDASKDIPPASEQTAQLYSLEKVLQLFEDKRNFCEYLYQLRFPAAGLSKPQIVLTKRDTCLFVGGAREHELMAAVMKEIDDIVAGETFTKSSETPVKSEDAADTEEQTLVVYKLKNTKADERFLQILRVCVEFPVRGLPPARSAVDQQTNSILVTGTSAVHKKVEYLLKQLDVPTLSPSYPPPAYHSLSTSAYPSISSPSVSSPGWKGLRTIPPSSTQEDNKAREELVWNTFGVKVIPVSPEALKAVSPEASQNYFPRGAVKVETLKDGGLFRENGIREGDMIAGIVVGEYGGPNAWSVINLQNLAYIAKLWTSRALDKDTAVVHILRDDKILSITVPIRKNTASDTSSFRGEYMTSAAPVHKRTWSMVLLDSPQYIDTVEKMIHAMFPDASIEKIDNNRHIIRVTVKSEEIELLKMIDKMAEIIIEEFKPIQDKLAGISPQPQQTASSSSVVSFDMNMKSPEHVDAVIEAERLLQSSFPDVYFEKQTGNDNVITVTVKREDQENITETRRENIIEMRENIIEMLEELNKRTIPSASRQQRIHSRNNPLAPQSSFSSPPANEYQYLQPTPPSNSPSSDLPIVTPDPTIQYR
ncbi:MAG: hypothetical protein LBQ54_04855 [Planctomycetaceae bacterium]|nr:hypothetical protein [Planctomycetaceae bacterium]